MKWTLNTAPHVLAKGMLIRRPGLDEALEVVNVRDGQAKIKLPGGKTSTIPATAEVEWSMPEAGEITDTKKKAGAEPEAVSEPDVDLETEPLFSADEIRGKVGDWQTDWSLLDVGTKISVLGEVGDFTIIRLGDSSARIKSDRTSQIQPLSIGHKFKIVGDGTDAENRPATGTKASKAKGKAAKSKPPTKAREVAEPEPETETDEPEPTLFDNEPSDDELIAIENGNDTDPLDDDDLDLSDLDESDNEDDPDNDLDNDNDDKENEPMPNRKSKPASISRSKPGPVSKRSVTDNDPNLLTLGQIAERVGISYPTLMRYVRDHGDRMPHEGEGRSRRYYPDTIDIVRQIRSEMKGGRPPGSGTKLKKAAKAVEKVGKEFDKIDSKLKSTATKKPEPKVSTSSAVGTWVATSNITIDQMLSSAIDHARAQISGLESLIDNLEAQRESLKLWS